MRLMSGPKIYAQQSNELMTSEPAKKGRGGARKGSGRVTNYRKRCELYAIQLEFVCSESTARRTLREWGGNLKRVIGSSKYYETLTEWDDLEEFDKGMVYGVLAARVTRMLEDGYGRRE
jgi:hypothetical protein